MIGQSTFGWTRMAVMATALLGLLAVAALAVFLWQPAPALAQSPPDAVGSITLTRSGSTLTVSWNAVSGATKYHALYQADGAGDWLPPIPDYKNITATSFTFDIDSGKSYVVGVRAGNANGWGAWTDSPVSSPPGPPDAVGSITLTRTDTALTVSWNAVDGATKYHAVYQPDGGDWLPPIPDHKNITATSFTFNVDSTKTYIVGVRAGNANGWGAWTDSPTSQPTVPPAVGSITLNRSGGTLTVSWNAVAGATKYHAVYQADGGHWLPPIPDHKNITATSFTFNIDSNKSYVVGVRAGKGSVWGEWTDSPFSHPPTPAAPASATLTRSGSDLVVSWDAVANATGYNVDYRDADGSDWARDATGATGTSATLTHGTNLNSSYQVRVQAVTGLVAGDWTESAVFHPALPPTAPYWVKAQRTGASQVTATWNGVSNAATFNVEYSDNNGASWTGGQTGVTGTSATLSLAVGKSYVVRVQGVNSHGVGAWQNSPALNSPYLSTAGIFQSTARVNIFNYSGSWYYKANVGPHSSCQGPVSTIHTTFSGLADSTTYTYTAYADSACNGGALTPAITFTTLNPPVWLTVTNVGDTTATLNMTQYPNKWWYAQVGDPSNFQCVEGPGPRSSVNLTGLTQNTRYTYVTYSEPQCPVASIVDRAYFSTTDAGAGNLTPTLDGSSCTFGSPVGHQGQSCAVSFTTGGDIGGGYFLHDVAVSLSQTFGDLGGVSVTVHAADANGNPAAAPLTTLSGTTQDLNDTYTFSCASDCYLYKNTTYFVVVSATNASLRGYRGWMTRNSAHEYAWPANSGWAIGNGAKQKSDANAWTNLSSGQTPVLHVAANETSATLSVSGVSAAGASLAISGHTGNWYYDADAGPHTSCSTAQSASSTVALSGLSHSTTYAYTAYSDSGCATPIAAVTFTTATIGLTVSEVTATGATLTLSGHSGAWYYQANAAPHTACTAAPTNATEIAFRGVLTPGTVYTYSAYTDSSCSAANKLTTASAFTTGGVSVSNLDETSHTYVAVVGNNNQGTAIEWANAFTTGSHPGGYRLASVLALFFDQTGSPGAITAAIHEVSGGNPAANALITLTGNNPTTAGVHEFTCSSNCSLAASTTYFFKMSATASGNDQYYKWKTTTSDSETPIPSGNGWSIANDSRGGSDLTTTNNNVAMMKVAATKVVGLATSNVTDTSVTLTIAGHSGNWHYQYTTPTGGSCASAGSGSTANVTGLSPNVAYTFKAYSDSSCSTELATAAAFTTYQLAVIDVSDTTAKLTLSNYPAGDTWRYKRVTPSGGTCSSAIAAGTTTADLIGLTGGTRYVFKAYSDASCNTVIATAPLFTTGYSVSSLPEDDGANQCLFSGTTKCAVSFETSAGAYILSQVIGDFAQKTGTLGNIVVSLHADADNNNEPDSGDALATLSGPNPTAAEKYTYTCSGAGCALSGNTRYFVQFTAASGDPNSENYKLKTTTSDDDNEVPTGSGWTLANSAIHYWTGSGDWLNLTNSATLKVKVVAMLKPGLSVSNLTDTSATLTMTDHSGAWWHKRTSPGGDDTCAPVAANSTTANLSGLSPGTSYTYKVYSKTGCANADEIASADFTTPQLTVANDPSTTATLTIAGHTGAWHYKSDTAGHNTCTSVTAGTLTANITGLTLNRSYTFSAYTDANCANRLATAVTFEAGVVTVSNLSEEIDGFSWAGRYHGEDRRSATAFTTGSHPDGYTLQNITAWFYNNYGSPNGLKVALHRADGTYYHLSSREVGDEIADATFSGDDPSGWGYYTYTCSGDGCSLNRNTEYWVVMSASNSNTGQSGHHRFQWISTASGGETRSPSNNGWHISNDSRGGASLGYVTRDGYVDMMKVKATVDHDEVTVTATRGNNNTASVSWTAYDGDNFKYYQVIVCTEAQHNGASCNGTVYKSGAIYGVNSTGPVTVPNLDPSTGYHVILQTWRDSGALKSHAALPVTN